MRNVALHQPFNRGLAVIISASMLATASPRVSWASESSQTSRSSSSLFAHEAFAGRVLNVLKPIADPTPKVTENQWIAHGGLTVAPAGSDLAPWAAPDSTVLRQWLEQGTGIMGLNDIGQPLEMRYDNISTFWGKDRHRLQVLDQGRRIGYVDFRVQGELAVISTRFGWATFPGSSAIWVKHSFRERGMGSRLLIVAEALARERGARVMEIRRVSEAPAIALYASRGYSPVSRWNPLELTFSRSLVKEPVALRDLAPPVRRVTDQEFRGRLAASSVLVHEGLLQEAKAQLEQLQALAPSVKGGVGTDLNLLEAHLQEVARLLKPIKSLADPEAYRDWLLAGAGELSLTSKPMLMDDLILVRLRQVVPKRFGVRDEVNDYMFVLYQNPDGSYSLGARLVGQLENVSEMTQWKSSHITTFFKGQGLAQRAIKHLLTQGVISAWKSSSSPRPKAVEMYDRLERDPDLKVRFEWPFWEVRLAKAAPASPPVSLDWETPEYSCSDETKDGRHFIRLSDKQAGSAMKVTPDQGNNLIAFKVTTRGVQRNILSGNGSPILWPFANRIDQGVFKWGDKTVDIRSLADQGLVSVDQNGHPLHGVAQHQPWVIEKTGADEQGVFITSSFTLDPVRFPEAAEKLGHATLRVTYRLKGTSLRIQAEMINQDDRTLPMSLAFHPWFVLPKNPHELARVTLQVPATRMWATRSDLIPHIQTPVAVHGKYDMRAPRRLGHKVQYDDVWTGLPLKSDGMSHSVLEIPLFRTRVRMKASAMFKHLVVYLDRNPDYPALCLEPQTSATDMANLFGNGINEATPLLIQPGQRQAGEVVLEYEPLRPSNELPWAPEEDWERISEWSGLAVADIEKGFRDVPSVSRRFHHSVTFGIQQASEKDSQVKVEFLDRWKTSPAAALKFLRREGVVHRLNEAIQETHVLLDQPAPAPTELQRARDHLKMAIHLSPSLNACLTETLVAWNLLATVTDLLGGPKQAQYLFHQLVQVLEESEHLWTVKPPIFKKVIVAQRRYAQDRLQIPDSTRLGAAWRMPPRSTLTLPQTYERGIEYFYKRPHVLTMAIVDMDNMYQGPVIHALALAIQLLNPEATWGEAFLWAQINRAVELFYSPTHEVNAVMSKGFRLKHLAQATPEVIPLLESGIDRLQEAVQESESGGIHSARRHLELLKGLPIPVYIPVQVVKEYLDVALLDIEQRFAHSPDKGRHALSVWIHRFHNWVYPDASLTLGERLTHRPDFKPESLSGLVSLLAPNSDSQNRSVSRQALARAS